MNEVVAHVVDGDSSETDGPPGRFETLLEHAAEGRIRIDADESNGVATVELAFQVQED